MQLTIRRGANEIGGSCVEIATEKTRLIFDVGVPLDAMDGTPPVPLNVPGLFQEGKRVDAILLSHSHLDHSGLLPKAHPEIPVCLSIGADKALSILRTFTRENLLRGRKLEKLIPGCMVQFGDIGVTPFEVDHSAPGCLAFLVESKGSTIVYSGDLRLHGRNPHFFETIKTGLRGKAINVLLMEGTTLSTGRGKGLTELELEEKIHEEIVKARGLVFALFSPLHLDRLKTFLKATVDSSRVFVPDLYVAYVMHMFQTEGFLSPTGLNEIPVFFNQGSRATMRRSKLNSDLERKRIALDRLLLEPSRFVLPARQSTFDLDFQIIPPQSTFLYSFWRGYLEKPQWKELQTRISLAGGHFIPCHTSGHIFPRDIKRFIEALRPEMLIPIHTAAARGFKELYSNTKLLADGNTLTVGHNS